MLNYTINKWMPHGYGVQGDDNQRNEAQLPFPTVARPERGGAQLPAYEARRRLADDHLLMMLLAGPGCGKTFLLSNMNKILRSGGGLPQASEA